MRILDPRLLLGAASLALVGLVVLDHASDPSPGPLHASHAALDELVGREGCVACHGETSEPAAMAFACGLCHEDIRLQLDGGTGFHGLMARDPAVDANDCAECHLEHHGDAIGLVHDGSFERAGIAGTGAFVHAGLGFELGGRHAALACDACHTRARASALAPGERRYMGLTQRCTACHDDPHAGEMTQGCAECHGQSEPFEKVALFEHTGRFPLDGPHAGLSCAACHAPGTKHAIRALEGPNPPTDRSCADCHGAPHDARFLARADVACAHCHEPASEGFGAADASRTALLHVASGFALENAHAEVECSTCHAPDLPFAERFPGRSANDCAACHADAHGGQFEGGPHDALGCARCHDTHGFKPSLFGAHGHGALGFALDGAHAAAECSACHQPGPDGGPSRFRGTPRRCSDCHDDVHEGAFARQDLLPGDPGCAACHGTEAFTPVLAGAFDHGRSTGFALGGAHERLECAACHGASPLAARSFGRVADRYPGPPERCDTCHTSPHGDRFNALREPGGAPLDCAGCHQASDFLSLLPGSFDHGQATGFELVGAHAEARCVACHAPQPGSERRLGDVRAAFAGPLERCDTCHTDPHGGAFEQAGAASAAEGEIGCARCHDERSFRSVEEFDHGRWTGWPLDGMHAEVSCAKCHRPEPSGALGRTRAFARGTGCADCHTDPHLGQFREPDVGVRCDRCHGTGSPFSDAVFDHDRARFTLDEVHGRLACARCHRPATTSDGRRAIRYRPLGRECQDCHDPLGGRRGGGQR